MSASVGSQPPHPSGATPLRRQPRQEIARSRGAAAATPTNIRATRSLLLLLCLLALLVRVGVVVMLRSWRHPDAMEHRSIALSLVSGHGFTFGDFGYFGPSSVQSPPYPFLLAIVFRAFGPDTPAAYFAAMALNALAGAAAVWLTYALARALGGTTRVAMLAAALVAAWPTQVYACTVAQAICLITAGLTAALALFQIAVRTGRPAPWIAFSLIGALAALTEPVFLPPLALAGVLMLGWRRLPGRVRLRNGAILLLTTMAVIGPWTVRNRIVQHAWIPIKSTTWVNAWKGNNDHASGTDRLALAPAQARNLDGALFSFNDQRLRDPGQDALRQYDLLTPAQLARLEGQPEAARERVFRQFTTEWVRAHPAAYLRLCGVRLAKTLWVDLDNPKSHQVVYLTSRTLLLLLSAAGIILAIRRRWSLLFPAVMASSCLLVYCLTITAARFAIPFEPLQLCFASLAIVAAWDRLIARRPRRRKVRAANPPITEI